MAATELATAYLSLVPSMRGAQGAIARELSTVDADGIGKNIGGRMGGGIAGSIKGLVGPALAAAGAVLFGGVVAEAARASDATDKFKGTLNFAGVDTSGIDAATKAAKDYADQTVYDLPTIQATMAQLAANGVGNYTELAVAAGNLNAVAGGNAETFQSVSRSLTQSAGAGKLMTEDWNMLADAIPGASGALQKSMKDAGAYTGNFREAMEKGQITSEEFQKAISELGSDPIAVEAAKSVTTFEGALGNLNATIQSGVMGALDYLKPQLTGGITAVSDGIGSMFGFLGKAIPEVVDLLGKGDFKGHMDSIFGFQEDSPAVVWMLKTHDVFAKGIPAIRDILVKGDFTGAMTEAFGVEEDSPVVGAMFTIREKVIEAFQGIKDFVSGFTIPMDSLLGAGVDVTPLMAIGSTVRDVFDRLGAAIAPLLPSLGELWMAVSPLGTVFAILLPFIEPLVGIIGELATSVGGGLLSAITGVLPAFQTIQAVVIDLFTNVLATALPLVVDLVGMFSETLAELIPILVPIISTVVMLAATLISQLAPIFMQLVTAVLPIVVSSLGLILSAIGPLVEMLASVLIPIIQALMPVVVTVFGVIVNLITSAMQIIQGIIQVVTGIISGNWAQVFEGLGNIVGGVFSFIVNFIGGALQIIGQVIISGVSMAAGFFVAGFQNTVGLLAGVWGNIVNGASNMISGLLGFFGGLPGKILGALGDFGGLLVSVGKDMIQGLINGISGMMGAIGRAVLSIVPEAIRGPFEDLLGIHSPSTVFRDYGHNIGQGLVLGLADMHGAVAAATEGLAYVPGAPEFASAYSLNAYAGYATPNDTAGNGTTINQYVQPSEKMSEENVANVAARKITGALV